MLEHVDVASRIAFARDHAERLCQAMSAGRKGWDVVTDERPPRPWRRGEALEDARFPV
jgi:hypothetical protein